MARILTRPMFRKGGLSQTARPSYRGGGVTAIRPGYRGGGMNGIMSGIVPRTNAYSGYYNTENMTKAIPYKDLQESFRGGNYASRNIMDIPIEQEVGTEGDITSVVLSELPKPEFKSDVEKAIEKDLKSEQTKKELLKENLYSNLEEKPKPKKKVKTETPSDKETVQDYIDMFRLTTEGEEDAERKNKYLALAQFGANLLSQPGGDLTGAIGKASTPAIQTLGKAMSDRRAADRQAKLLGTQAYLKGIEPGALRKQINDLIALGYTKEGAINKIVDEGRGTATRERTQVTKRQNLSKELEEEGIPPRQAGVISGKILDSKVPDYNYSLLPDNPVEGEYYYDKKGNVGKYVVKNDVGGLDDGKE